MKFNRTLLGLAASLALAGAAQADVLTFEDLLSGSLSDTPLTGPNTNGLYALDAPSGNGSEFFGTYASPVKYTGFSFGMSQFSPDSGGTSGSWFYTARTASGSALSTSTPVYVSTEGVCAPATVGGACTVSETTEKLSFGISNSLGFYFQGASFNSQSSSVPIAYVLTLGGVTVFDGTIANTTLLNVNGSPPFTTPVFINSNYNGLIDTVYIYSRQGQFGMDNFTYSAAPIPEPGTYALMLAGLVGVGALARRRKQAK